MMKRRNRLSKWVALAVTGLGGVSLVAMVAMMAVTGGLISPDPAFAKFDMTKLTVSGDIRVRGEFRNNRVLTGVGNANDQFAIQKTRLRLKYDTTADTAFFIELQDSRVYGANDGSDKGSAQTGGLGFGGNPGDIHGEAFGVRQAYIWIGNAGVQGLNLKIGRQKLVFGDQRILGHFDWSNIGWSFDGVRADYASKLGSHTVGWFRQAEQDCVIDTSLCGDGGPGTDDSDFVLWYNTLKMVPGMVVEPYLIYVFDGRDISTAAGTAGTTVKDGRLGPDQKRLMLGGRVAGKAMKKMIDYTGEVVWQTGQQKNGAAPFGRQTINAWAAATKFGVTLPAPMKPRIGGEFAYASGSASDAADPGGRHTFENFWPTNHLHYGYMDHFSWKNMVAYSPQFSVKPTKGSLVKVNYWIFRLAQVEDNWYHAGQGLRADTVAGNQAASLGQELNVIVKQKFKGGKIGVTLGYGHFFAGEYLEKSKLGTGGGAGKGDADSDWGYISVAHKF